MSLVEHNLQEFRMRNTFKLKLYPFHFQLELWECRADCAVHATCNTLNACIQISIEHVPKSIHTDTRVQGRASHTQSYPLTSFMRSVKCYGSSDCSHKICAQIAHIRIAHPPAKIHIISAEILCTTNEKAHRTVLHIPNMKHIDVNNGESYEPISWTFSSTLSLSLPFPLALMTVHMCPHERSKRDSSRQCWSNGGRVSRNGRRGCLIAIGSL